MPAFVGTLWVVGVVLLVGAVIGQAVTLGGTELPALTSVRLRWTIAGIGVFALLLGSLLFAQNLSATSGAGGGHVAEPPPSTATGSQRPSSPVTGRTSPSASPTPDPPRDPAASQDERTEDPPVIPSPSASKAAPARPAVKARWKGTLLIYSNGAPTGWWLDQVPPAQAVIGDLGLECDCHAGEVVANAIAEWDGPQAPTYQQCSSVSGQLARRALAVTEGTKACLRTQNGRLGSITVTSVAGPYEMNVEATVWDRG
ncbi:hypothetical protein ACIREE_33345 [Streptomyces sp. NPDC102467]|uniref:hypothetical protein n=1 Tax=Streptomyces sp. NPDC102467 TaxID=3366179 RepID=UPI00382CF10C